MKTKKKLHKVYLPEMISVELLSEHPNNSNKQSTHVFNELKASIEEHGFDEPLIVSKRPDDQGYYVVSGNHRYKAGKEVGYLELPCIVRNDWDTVEQQIQLVRRNYVRGQIDKTAFTDAVNRLCSDEALLMDDVMSRMGFESHDDFAALYKQQAKRERSIGQAMIAQSQNQPLKILEDIQIIVSVLMEKYGHTIPQSFLVIPVGGRNHQFINISPAMKKALDSINLLCVSRGLDFNTVLAGYLAIAEQNTNFSHSRDKEKEILEAGKLEGDSNPALIPDKT